MNYNFTDRVRKVLAMAREEAIRLQHDYVGTEHILLGLIREGEGVAAAVLANLAADLDELGRLVEDNVRRGKSASTLGELPYTSRAKKVLEFAMAEARELNHSYVGTEHLLLGLLRIGERSIAAAYGWHRGARTTLFQMGFDPDQAAHAPGTVLAAHVLQEQVFGQGRTSLDLGEGCYPWKLHWSTTVEHQVDVELHGQGAPALVRRLGAQAVVGLCAWAGANLRGRRCHGQAPDTAVSRSRCAHAGCDFPTQCQSRTVSQSSAPRDD